jgi:ribosomal protein L11 methyltransferase
MAPQSRLLLAGLLEAQAEQIIAAYAPRVTLAIADQQEEWVLLAGERFSA